MKVLTLLFAWMAVMAAPVLARAEMKPGAAGGMEMQEMVAMHGSMGDGMMLGMMPLGKLDLAPDQKTKIQTLRLQHQKEVIPILGRVRLAGIEIQELLLATPVDNDTLKAKVKNKHEAMAELETAHLALAQTIQAVLTPEQRQKFESMMMEHTSGMEGMMGEMMGGMMGQKPKGPRSKSSAPAAAPGKPGGAPPTADAHGH